MPYRSQKQAGYFHTHEAEIGPKVVAEFDRATKGMHLPKAAQGANEHPHDKARREKHKRNAAQHGRMGHR